MRLCSDCQLAFFQRNKKSLRCRPCASKAIAKQKQDSQNRRRPAKRRNELKDIDEDEVDRRFAAALKEIRRQPSEGMEPFRSYGWLYREPRS